MVYCGKPSKGCKNCRERKIRCNQAVPACAQCVKAGKECPGYRNMLDLAFRNESESVIEKAKAKAKQSLSKSNGASSALGEGRPSAFNSRRSRSELSTSSLAHSPGTLQISALSIGNPECLDLALEGPVSGRTTSIFSMAPSLQEVGMNFFCANFVAPPIGPSHGYFPAVHELSRLGGLDDTLKASISAAGLAGYANEVKSAPLMSQARREYAASLQKINTALRSPMEAIKDSTLLSILIVAIFETIVGAKQLSLKEWTEHVIGAATLLKFRGRAQLTTAVGSGLFMAACSHILLSCMQRETPMPPQLIELRAEAFDNIPSDPGWDYLKRMDQFTIFRSDVKSGIMTDPEAIIARALKLDGELMDIFDDVPEGWLYETVFTDTDNEIVWKGCYDIYYDVWISHMWNAMRCTRIMLNEMIRFRLLGGFTSRHPRFVTAEYRALFQVSTTNCIEMRDGILRSIPQHCGYVTRKPFTGSYSSPETSPPPPGIDIFATNSVGVSFTDLLTDADLPALDGEEPSIDTSSFPTFVTKDSFKRDPSFPMIGGYFLMWPLYVAGIARISNQEIQKFVAKTLCYIGDEIGFRQGTNLAKFMEAHSTAPEKGADAMEMAETVERPKRPLLEMLAKEEAERLERLGKMSANANQSVSVGVE